MLLEEKLVGLKVNNMIGFKIKSKGDWNDTEHLLNKLQNKHDYKVLEKYGREGVAALSAATPVDTGVTASSWDYRIEIQNGQSIKLIFTNNSKTKDGIPIVILLHYGHGNGRGGYIQGRDFINPVVQPLFDKIADEFWREVIR